MGAARIIILAFAAVVAIGLAFLVRGLASRPPRPAPVMAQAAPTVRVLVARRDLPQGTRLSAGDMGWQSWPIASLNPSFVTDGRAPERPATTPAAAVQTTANHVVATAATAALGGGPMESRYGAIVRQTLLVNEPVTDAKLVRAGDSGFMAVMLHPGMLAFSVPVTVEKEAGGFILPGDRVDVFESHTPQAAAGTRGDAVAHLLMRNVRVLAIDQGSQPPKAVQAVVGATATLEVTAADVETLVRSRARGDISLALRAYADAGGPSGRVGDDDDGVTKTGVRIFRDGAMTEMAVAQ